MAESTEFMSGRVPVSLKRKVKAEASLRGLDLADALKEGMAAWLQATDEQAPARSTVPLCTEAIEVERVFLDDSQAAEQTKALIRLALSQYKATKAREAGGPTKARASEK